MKIVFLSPVHPLLTFGDPLPRWQMQMSRILALRELGHQVEVIKYTPDNKISLSLLERILYNIRVIKQIATSQTPRNDKTSLIIYSLGSDVLFPFTVYLIKVLLKAPLVVLSGVSPVESGNRRERKMGPLFDLVVTNDDTHGRQWLKLGAKKAVNLPLSAMDPELHFPRKAKVRDIDVLFVGTITNERKKFLNEVRKLLPSKVKVVFKHFVFEEEYAKLMSRAKIVLNLLRREMKDGANLRMFEASAFGALLLGNSGRKEWLQPGREMVMYGDEKDATGKIIYYLKNTKERQRIAKNGMERVKKEHTFLKRSEKMLLLLKSL